MRFLALRVFAVVSLLASSAACVAQKSAKPWPIRAVIVTTFEIGNDTGDAPGEFQLWAEREHLDEVVEFPGGIHPLRTNADHSVLGMVSGTTLVNATASMMALGLDPRFDLSRAYFLINGIAGVDPHEASIGSVAWASFVINDVGRAIDPHDAPAAWPYGIFPIGATAPRPDKVPEGHFQKTNLYKLNGGLTSWAYAQTKDLKLGDDATVAKFRTEYTNTPNARKPPFVLRGDTFASDLYWHGAVMTQYAEDWVKLYTEGKGSFVMTEMEDSGYIEAIERLNAMHRVDLARVMVLRGGSNYCMPRPSHTAVESVTAPYIGTRLALENIHLTGSTVLHTILKDWDKYEGTAPRM